VIEMGGFGDDVTGRGGSLGDLRKFREPNEGLKGFKHIATGEGIV
jgi:hypothetical protein